MPRELSARPLRACSFPTARPSLGHGSDFSSASRRSCSSTLPATGGGGKLRQHAHGQEPGRHQRRQSAVEQVGDVIEKGRAFQDDLGDDRFGLVRERKAPAGPGGMLPLSRKHATVPLKTATPMKSVTTMIYIDRTIGVGAFSSSCVLMAQQLAISRRNDVGERFNIHHSARCVALNWAVTVVVMPPRGVNAATSCIHRGSTAATRSSRMRLVACS